MSELPKGWVETTIGESITLNDKHVGILDDMECGFVPMSMVPTKYGKVSSSSPKLGENVKKAILILKIMMCC